MVDGTEEECQRDVDPVLPSGGRMILAAKVPTGKVFTLAVTFLAQEGIHAGLPGFVLTVQPLAAIVKVKFMLTG